MKYPKRRTETRGRGDFLLMGVSGDRDVSGAGGTSSGACIVGENTGSGSEPLLHKCFRQDCQPWS